MNANFDTVVQQFAECLPLRPMTWLQRAFDVNFFVNVSIQPCEHTPFEAQRREQSNLAATSQTSAMHKATPSMSEPSH